MNLSMNKVLSRVFVSFISFFLNNLFLTISKNVRCTNSESSQSNAHLSLTTHPSPLYRL